MTAVGAQWDDRLAALGQAVTAGPRLSPAEPSSDA